MFCVIKKSKRTLILEVIGQLFFELWCTQIETNGFEKNAFSFENSKLGAEWRHLKYV